MKPQDIPLLLKSFKKAKRYLGSLTDEVKTYLKDATEGLEEESEESIKQMNFYLTKILEIKPEYKGEYSIKAVKKHYFELLEELSTEESVEKSSNN